MATEVTIHEVKFQRNQFTKQWRALCTCGWSWAGTQEECQSRAATHDIEWQDEPTTILVATK